MSSIVRLAFLSAGLIRTTFLPYALWVDIQVHIDVPGITISATLLSDAHMAEFYKERGLSRKRFWDQKLNRNKDGKPQSRGFQAAEKLVEVAFLTALN